MDLIGKAAAAAQHDSDDKRRYAGGRVHHQPTGEVHDSERAEPTAAPDPMADRRVDHDEPHPAQNEHGLELDALDIGADHQGRGDDGKGHLENGKNDLGNRAG